MLHSLHFNGRFPFLCLHHCHSESWYMHHSCNRTIATVQRFYGREFLSSKALSYRLSEWKGPELHNITQFLHIQLKSMMAVADGSLMPPDFLSPENLQAAFIGGEWITSDTVFEVKDPSTELCIAKIPDLNSVHVDQAICSASEAFQSYKKLTVKDRHDILMRWFHLVKQFSNELSRLIVLENGKSLSEAEAEINYANGFIEWFAEQSRGQNGFVIPSPISTKRLFALKEPVGVCGVIIPWNFPAAMLTRKIAAALAVGCTVVCKPAEETPLTCLAFAKLAEMAGLPKGVLNIISCSNKNIIEVGRQLCQHPLVKKISFTGSTTIGKRVMELASTSVKKLSLELGGNAPFIVFEDAEIENAVDGLLQAKFRASGQTCVCVNRTFVHSSIWNKFVSSLLVKVAALKIGNGFEKEVSIGPLINAKAVHKVETLVKNALSAGAVTLYPLKPPASPFTSKGYFYSPTILDCRGMDISEDNQSMNIFHEEIFGPVIALYSFQDESSVLSMANSVNAGLAGYVYTQSLNRSMRVMETLQVGMVALNCGSLSHPEGPFGGIKNSGFGREGSQFGLEEYTNIKYICMGGLSS